MAFIIEQAGGKAITCGLDRILEITPKEIHSRCTCVMGSPDMVDDMQKFVQRYQAM